MAMISDKYYLIHEPVDALLKRWDDAGDEAVGKRSGRKSAMIRLVKPFWDT